MVRDKSMRVDMSFSGLSDLRVALNEEEEYFDNISNCSFVEGTEAKQINQQIAISNVLDKGQFLASQNSMH